MKKNINSIQSLGLLLAALSLLPVVSSHAQSILTNSIWTTAGDGNWDDPGNWLGSVPALPNAVSITNATTKTITVAASTPTENRAARRLDLKAPSASTNTLRLDNLGPTPFLLANTLSIEAGGRMEIINSSLIVDGTLGGSFNQWAGELKLSGGTIVTTNGAEMRIGRNGLGVMQITGGQLWAGTNLSVGSSFAGADGTLTMSNGLVRVDGKLVVGDDAGAFGRINMPGGTLVATNISTDIGDQGNGTLAISGGSALVSGLSVGNSGVGLVTVAGGGLNVISNVVISKFNGASGTLAISNGLVQVGELFTIADNIGAIGQVHVAGGVLIATNPVFTARIGDDGEGTLTISSGAVFMDDTSVGRSVSSMGRLRIHGGTMQAGSVSLGRFDDAIGTLEMAGGTLDLGGNTLHIGREGQGFAFLTNGTIYAANVFLASANVSPASLQLEGATIITGQFRATSPNSGEIQIQFNSGRLETSASTVAYGAPFVVGDGVRPAVLYLNGGTHTFTDGLTISSNATLIGTGTVLGQITVFPGGNNQLGVAPTPIVLVPLTGDGPFRFSFSSMVGRFYDVFAVTNLAQPQWQLQATLAGNGATLIFTNPIPDVQRYFRVLAY